VTSLVERLGMVAFKVEQFLDEQMAKDVREAAARIEELEGEVHLCPTCGEKCVECKCQRARIAALEEALRYARERIHRDHGGETWEIEGGVAAGVRPVEECAAPQCVRLRALLDNSANTAAERATNSTSVSLPLRADDKKAFTASEGANE
jgi:hypothetical protein